LYARIQTHAVSTVKTRDTIWNNWHITYVERNE
jgi:hypothetical protein